METDTKILAADFEFLEPTTLEEAVDLLGRFGDRARILAGGTDLLVKMKTGVVSPQFLVCIKKIPELSGLKWVGDGLRIGAATPLQRLLEDGRVRESYPALHEAVRSMAAPAVRHMGTVGGNLGNASPAADTAPPLIVYGATAVVAGPAGRRTVPVEELFTGPGKTILSPRELLIEINLPPTAHALPTARAKAEVPTAEVLPTAERHPASEARPDASTVGSSFMKLTRVAADIAKINIAVLLERQLPDGVCRKCRIAFGSVAPTPVRAKKAESALEGREVTASTLREAAVVASEEISPITDIRSTAAYRKQVSRVLVEEAGRAAWLRAGGEVR